MSTIHLNNISYSVANKKIILDNINYQINQGDFVILLGSNGSGKSSLLKILHQDYFPSQGELCFPDYFAKKFSQEVALLNQHCGEALFSDLTVYENYLLYKKTNLFTKTIHKHEREFLPIYLQDFNPNLMQKLDTPVHQLSGGEMQALALAFCLLKKPSLLLLDEHTSALDPKTSKQIMELTQRIVKKYAMTCVLTTHDLDDALQYGDRILMLREGKMHRVYEPLAKQQLSKMELLREYC